MNSLLVRDLGIDEIESYDRDGVILLRGMFDLDWIELLSEGLDFNCDNPGSRSRIWDRDADGRTMFYDAQAWQGNEHYRKFIFDSPCAELVAQLMQTNEVNFYFDAVFVRSAGSQFTTPWHQDEPYWSVEGYNTCTIWMPLVPLKKENALAYVPGSHHLDKIYQQHNFGELNPDGLADVDQVDFSAIAEAAFPDIDANPDRFGVVSWDMQPGDCVAFNSRIMHGGSGKLAEDRDLRVFTSKWLGDDVRIQFRQQGMDPDHSTIMTAHGLKPGDRPGGDLYPLIWPRK